MEAISRCCRSAYTTPISRQKAIIIGGAVLFTLGLFIVVLLVTSGDDDRPYPVTKGSDTLKNVPLTVGQSDLPALIIEHNLFRLKDYDFLNSTDNIAWMKKCISCATDLEKLNKGMVSNQIWSVKVPCVASTLDAVALTLEQIDLVRRLLSKYSQRVLLSTETEDVTQLFEHGKKMSSMIGVKGGHSLDMRLSLIRIYYTAGVRYMALTTEDCSTPWASSSKEDKDGGLKSFGEAVVAEMNRVGMLVDLSTASKIVQLAVLEKTKSPAIFSSSNAKAKCDAANNLPDDVLDAIKLKDGLVMVSFDPGMVKVQTATDKVAANITHVIGHLNHLKEKIGADRIGIGANFDGYEKKTVGLESAEKLPQLFDELKKNGWSVDDLEKLAGKNFLRILKLAEDKAKELQKSTEPDDQLEAAEDLKNSAVKGTCYSDWKLRYPTLVPTSKP